jgi:hypothetical protein
VGLLSFHIGPEPTSSLCSLVGATSPPDNCILKVGGVLSRSGGGSLAGEILLTIESVDGAHAVTFPHPLPLTAERMSLEDFPGALPQ